MGGWEAGPWPGPRNRLGEAELVPGRWGLGKVSLGTSSWGGVPQAYREQTLLLRCGGL